MQRGRPFQRTAFLVAAGILAPLGARAADPQPYTVAITPTGDGAIDAALKGSSLPAFVAEERPSGAVRPRHPGRRGMWVGCKPR